LNILIVEDNHERIRRFLRMLNDQDISVDVATDYWAALPYIESGKEYDIMFLDHDLGGPSDENLPLGQHKEHTGSDLANTIVNTIQYKPWFILHSLNYSGADNMKNTLDNHGFTACKLPFIGITQSTLKSLITSWLEKHGEDP